MRSWRRTGLSRRWRGPTGWFLRWWATGSGDGGRTTRSPWAPRSVRSGRRRTGGCAPNCERPGAGKRAPRKAASFLRPEGPGRRPVRAASTAVDRKLPDHHDVPLSESVSIRLLCLAGPGAIKNRATQEGARRLGRVGPQQLPRHPAGTAASHAAGARRGVETSPDTVRARHALPGPARPHSHAERTRRHRPGRRARARAPTWSGAGSRRLAGSEVGGRHPLVPAPGEGPDLPGDRCRAAAPGRWSGTRLGRQHAAPTPLCEAIDMAARRRPHTTGGETVFHSDRGCQYTSDPSSSPST